MSGITVARDEDMLIDVEIPLDIVQALEQSGAAMQEPAVVEKKPEPKPEPKVQEEAPKKVAPSFSEADMEAARRQAAEAQARGEALAKTVDVEKAARVKAEEEALSSRFAVVNSHYRRTEADKAEIVAYIANWESAADVAKRNLALARESGNLEDETAAIRAMTKAEHMIGQLKTAEANADTEIERARRQAEMVAAEVAEKKEAPRKEDPAPAAEPKQKTPDEWIAQFPRKTASWLRENKDFVTDPSKNGEFIAFVKDWAEDYGHSTVNGPQFLDALSAKFSPKPTKQEITAVAEEPETEEEVEIDTAPKRKTSAPAAPVSRSTAPTKPSGNGSTTKVRLTPDQYAIAPALYPEAGSEAEARAMYAQDLLRAQSEGKFAPRE